jgi:sec-independent protein translocase protein TatA
MWELMLIFLVVLLLFGAKRLPEIGSSLGKGIREFKGSIREIEGDLNVPDEKPRVSRAADPQENRDEGTDG